MFFKKNKRTTSKKERLLEYLAVGDLGEPFDFFFASIAETFSIPDNLTEQEVAEIDVAGAEFAQLLTLQLHPWLVLLARVAIIVVIVCFIGSSLLSPQRDKINSDVTI
jgi:hypothetical protein